MISQMYINIFKLYSASPSKQKNTRTKQPGGNNDVKYNFYVTRMVLMVRNVSILLIIILLF